MNSCVGSYEIVTIFFTLFLCWMVEEILQRQFKITPKIRGRDSIIDAVLSHDTQLTLANKEKIKAQRNLSLINSTRVDINSDTNTGNNNYDEKISMIFRLTHSLDHDGYYRMEQRASVYIVKAIWCVLLTTLSTVVAVTDFDWFIKHYIKLDASSVDYMPYRVASSTILAYYAWEMNINKKGRLDWSVIVHHWLTRYFIGIQCF